MDPRIKQIMTAQHLLAYLAFAIALPLLAKSAVQLYKNRKNGTPLPEDWGATICGVLGFIALSLFYVLPPEYLGKSHFLLVFVGFNLMLAAVLSRFRYLRKYSEAKPDPALHGPNRPERIPNR